MEGEKIRVHAPDKIADVKRLKDAGKTQKQIQTETGVPPRTQRDWERKGLLGDSATWPQAHKWPATWTIDRIEEKKLPDFRRDLWESHLSVIKDAEALGNHRVGWFYKNLIELAGRHDMPDGSINWSVAIAALPALGEWLNCPPCAELAELIERLRPWEGNRFSRQRANYRRESRSLAVAVKQCVLNAKARLAMGDFAANRQSPVTVAVAVLSERIPMFDRVPRGSKFRKVDLGVTVLGILATPKGE